MADFIKSNLDTLSTSALWYAWGRIDEASRCESIAHPTGLTTDHGVEFQNAYTDVCRQYAAGDRSSRPSVLDAWARFVDAKKNMGWAARVTDDDIAEYRPVDPTAVPARRGINADDV